MNWKPFAIGLMVVVIAAAIGSAGVTWNANAQEGTGPVPEPTIEIPTVEPPTEQPLPTEVPTEVPTQVPPPPTQVPPTEIPPTETPVPTATAVPTATPDVQATQTAKILHQVDQIRAELSGMAVTQNNLFELDRLILEDLVNVQAASGDNQQQIFDILNDWSAFFQQWHDQGNPQLDAIATAIAGGLPLPQPGGGTVIEICNQCPLP